MHMVANRVAGMVADMVADKEVEQVADKVAGHGCWLACLLSLASLFKESSAQVSAGITDVQISGTMRVALNFIPEPPFVVMLITIVIIIKAVRISSPTSW